MGQKDFVDKLQSTLEEGKDKVCNLSSHTFDFNTSSGTIASPYISGLTTTPLPSLTSAQIQSLSIPNTFSYHNNYSAVPGMIVPAFNTGSTKIALDGPEADIEINGVSLTKRLDGIAERLNLLVINSKLEKEWDELRELGERYRETEAKLKEQSKMWDKLKSMPPPPLST